MAVSESQIAQENPKPLQREQSISKCMRLPLTIIADIDKAAIIHKLKDDLGNYNFTDAFVMRHRELIQKEQELKIMKEIAKEPPIGNQQQKPIWEWRIHCELDPTSPFGVTRGQCISAQKLSNVRGIVCPLSCKNKIVDAQTLTNDYKKYFDYCQKKTQVVKY
jgi:hypothetical protein